MPTLRVNDIQIYYEWHGLSTAPVVILNNGILLNTADWDAQTVALAHHYRVLLYDCRGQGQSDHPADPYSMAQHAHDLDELLTALQVERAHIAGISYGGVVAQVFVLNYPARVASLFLADTASEIGSELRLIVEDFCAHAQANDLEGLLRAMIPWCFSAQFISLNPQIMADSVQASQQLDLAAVARLCTSFLEVNLTGRLREIHVPTCILVGEQDQLTGRAYAELLHRYIQQSELHVLPGAGHTTLWERADAFNTVLLGFLAKQAY